MFFFCMPTDPPASDVAHIYQRSVFGGGQPITGGNPRSRRQLGAGLLAWCFRPIFAQGATIHGIHYVRLSVVAGRLKCQFTQTGRQASLVFQKGRIDFTIHQRDCLFFGVRVYLGFPITEIEGQLGLAESDYERSLKPLLYPSRYQPKPNWQRVVIDAGHGGKDPGALNAKLRLEEKTLTLDLAQRLDNILRQKGYQTFLTRTQDVFVGLEERSLLATQVKADFFLSLHFNAAAEVTVRGVETYCFTPVGHPSTSRSKVTAEDRVVTRAHRQDVWNLLGAYSVQRSLVARLSSPDRGVKRARFTVLKNLPCAGILVEGGFVSHPEEGKALGSVRYREQMAMAIAEGLVDYRRRIT